MDLMDELSMDLLRDLRIAVIQAESPLLAQLRAITYMAKLMKMITTMNNRAAIVTRFVSITYFLYLFVISKDEKS